MTQAEQFLKLVHTNPADLSEEENERIQTEFEAVASLAEDTITSLEAGNDKTGCPDMRLTFPDGSFFDMPAERGIRRADGTVIEEYCWRF